MSERKKNAKKVSKNLQSRKKSLHLHPPKEKTVRFWQFFAGIFGVYKKMFYLCAPFSPEVSGEDTKRYFSKRHRPDTMPDRTFFANTFFELLETREKECSIYSSSIPFLRKRKAARTLKTFQIFYNGEFDPGSG